MSEEKFVRDKPHVNIGLIGGLFVIGFALAAGLTYLYPDTIPLGYLLLTPEASSLRDSMLHTSRILVNGILYGIAAVAVGTVIIKGKKILQN